MEDVVTLHFHNVVWQMSVLPTTAKTNKDFNNSSQTQKNLIPLSSNASFHKTGYIIHFHFWQLFQPQNVGKIENV